MLQDVAIWRMQQLTSGNQFGARRLLGISDQADFEEVVDARNYLVELYKWHEESRESIELAFDTIIQVCKLSR